MEMKKTNNSTNSESVEKLEERIGSDLPKEYKDFLLTYNGGKPNRYIFPETEELYSLALNELYGLNTGKNATDINWNLDVFHNYERIMNQFIPIGDVINGDQFVLGISGPFRGKVYLWDHNQEVHYDDFIENELPANMYLLADSLDEFLNKLEEDN